MQHLVGIDGNLRCDHPALKTSCTSRTTREHKTPESNKSVHKKDCAGCAVRPRCTRSTTGPRELTLHPQAQQLALQAARERQQTESFKALSKRRAGSEGTLSQAA